MIQVLTGRKLDDWGYMDRAVLQARKARLHGMRPFGAVIVDANGRVIAESCGSETPTNPLRHSEMLAIKKACAVQGGLLHGCTLYQTLEPCTLCVGAITHSKLSRVICGAMRSDLPQLFRQKRYSAEMLLGDTTSPPELIIGVLRRECIALFDQEVSNLWRDETST